MNDLYVKSICNYILEKYSGIICQDNWRLFNEDGWICAEMVILSLYVRITGFDGIISFEHFGDVSCAYKSSIEFSDPNLFNEIDKNILEAHSKYNYD